MERNLSAHELMLAFFAVEREFGSPNRGEMEYRRIRLKEFP
jgi:hypothetical protein